MATFAELQSAYPAESREKLFAALGGEWPSKLADARYRNTCAIRMSVALRKVGVAIPAKFREAMQGDGAPLVLKCETLGALLVSVFGPPTWGMSKRVGVPLTARDLPAWPGIIAYHVKWADATGHVDLWTGRAFVGTGNLADIQQGFDIALWRVG